MHICAELSAASWMLEPFGEVGPNFHHEHSLLKSKIKKIIAENQCEKHKKIYFKLGLLCLAPGHNTVTPVRLVPTSPRSRVKHSTTEKLRSLEWDLKDSLSLITYNQIYFFVHELLQAP